MFILDRVVSYNMWSLVIDVVYMPEITNMLETWYRQANRKELVNVIYNVT